MRLLIKNLLVQSKTFTKNLRPWHGLIYVASLSIIVFLFSFQLGGSGLLPGYSQQELAISQIIESLSSIFENFLYWPYYLIAYTIDIFVGDPALSGRIASVLFGLISCWLFIILLRHRLGIFMTTVGVLFLATNSWLLQAARVAQPDGSTMAIGLALVTSVYLITKDPSRISWRILFLITVLLACATPLLPWLVIIIFALGILQWRKWQLYWSTRWQVAFYSVLGVSLLLIFFDSQNNSSNWQVLFGIPLEFDFGNSLSNFWQTCKALVWQAPYRPAHWLAQLPFLDILLAAMLPLGVYALHQIKHQSAKRILVALLLGLLVILGLNQGLATAGSILLLLAVLIIALLGLNFLFSQWRKTFPINPLARMLNIIAIALLISMSLFYHGRRYFVAWVNHPETREIYSHKSVNSD